MSLYIARSGAPTVMVKRVGLGRRYASFCLDHAMVFEDYELIEIDKEEYHFTGRDGKEYYFTVGDIKKMDR